MPWVYVFVGTSGRKFGFDKIWLGAKCSDSFSSTAPSGALTLQYLRPIVSPFSEQQISPGLLKVLGSSPLCQDSIFVYVPLTLISSSYALKLVWMASFTWDSAYCWGTLTKFICVSGLSLAQRPAPSFLLGIFAIRTCGFPNLLLYCIRSADIFVWLKLWWPSLQC